MKVIVDLMGTDLGPLEIVKGVKLTLDEEIINEVICVGNRELIGDSLRDYKEKVQIVNTTQQIGMDEKPSFAIKSKPKASILIALKLAKEDKENSVVISGGNTGAIVISSVMIYGKMRHVSRPGILVHLPTKDKVITMIDVGATVDSKPKNLLEFTKLAKIYNKVILKKENPTVGLLSIGEESVKGNKLILSSYEALAKSNLNFVGNVEGKDIFQSKVDIVVCDGFVGNVALKFAEGVAEAIMQILKEGITSTIKRKLGYLFLKDMLIELKKKMDYSEYGGGVLLGVDGNCIICHGRSNANAIKNAIKLAKKIIQERLYLQIRKEFGE